MKVLYCVSEVAPIVKVGGLGDVAGSLPKALVRLGVEIRIVVPRYQDIKILGDCEITKTGEIEVKFAGKEEKVVVWETTLPNSTVPVYLLENERYLSRNNHQAFAGTVSEVERFAFFSKAIAELLHHPRLPKPGTGGQASSLIPHPDLLHLNDWHTSLIPLLLPESHNLPSLLTIHNLSYQGLAETGLLDELGFNPDSCRVLKWDTQNRDIDLLMEGIIHATLVNTVSPTYAREIMTPEFGWGIDKILKGKEGRVSGILNGIDDEVWNSETDKLINFQFSLSNFQMGKAENKQTLQKELGLAVDEKIPILAFIGRLEPKQKGLDILYEAMERLLAKERFQLVLLGTGDLFWKKQFGNLAMKQSDNFKFICRFDERLAHQIYAGADIILMPSKFEPCGLPQMIAMRYGTLPLVRKTGGLADTVVDGKTGFVFEEYSSEALTETIERAIKLLSHAEGRSAVADNREIWSQMIKNAMSQDFSWEKSAKEYLNLYKLAIEIENSKK